jgi:hypothetical protein
LVGPQRRLQGCSRPASPHRGPLRLYGAGLPVIEDVYFDREAGGQGASRALEELNRL